MNEYQLRAWKYYEGPRGYDKSLGPNPFHKALRDAFVAGWEAATEHAASLHESVDPASDDERLSRSPGAGAMGAVIQYRDLIRRGTHA